tara:strand:- start:2296 stop:2688 length:393 start_codon:yes stop_codon:yes gene_type:complete
MERLQSYIDETIKNESLNHKQINDGHHTFEELYNYRMMYHALAVNITQGPLQESHKSRKHHNGDLCFGGGWFVVSSKINGKLISNHYKDIPSNWNLFKIPEKDKELWPFDPKETPQKQLENLKEFLQGEM